LRFAILSLAIRSLLLPGLLALCAACRAQVAPAGPAPIRFGLWQGTLQQQTTAAPATVSALKQKGQDIPPSFTQKYRKCIDQARWTQTKAAVQTAPQGCTFLHRSNTPSSLAMSLKCTVPDGRSIVIDSNIAWQDRVTTHASNRMTTIYPGSIGKVVRETTIESHFVSPDCGALAPGETAPVQ
jgi:hypothetical protein